MSRETVGVVLVLAAVGTASFFYLGGQPQQVDPKPALAKPSPAVGKPTLVVVSSPGCLPCRRLKRELTASPVYAFVMVFTEDAKAYGAAAFPTLVRLDGSGKETGRLVGYRPRAEVFAWMASP